jgi:hypothetical protein
MEESLLLQNHPESNLSSPNVLSVKYVVNMLGSQVISSLSSSRRSSTVNVCLVMLPRSYELCAAYHHSGR